MENKHWNKNMVNEFVEMAGLGLNDQEIANGLGIEPSLLGKMKANFAQGPDLSVGNVFTGWWSNNWVPYETVVKED